MSKRAGSAPMRKPGETQAEKWLKQGLPKGHGLAPTWVIARQITVLEEQLVSLFRTHQERYARYIEEHPPALAPVAKEATRDLPKEATSTYHAWLEDITERRRDVAHFELDRAELSAALREALEEGIGTGAEGALRALGASAPGFAPLKVREARKLLHEIASYAAAESLEARGIYQAVADRASGKALRASVLRDGAGRLVAAASYRTNAQMLEIVHLGALEGRLPGTGVKLMRELAALAAKEGKGIAVRAPAAANPFFSSLGFVSDSSGFLRLASPGAKKLASELLVAGPGVTGATSFGGQLTWELAVAGASEWLQAHKIPKVVDEISEATHQALVDALADGLGRGESTQQLAWRVRHLDKAFGRVRAERIARTEVLTANRHGAYHIGKEAGCKEHEWRSRVESPRTREWHYLAHRQRVPYDQPYLVLNRKGEVEKLLYPGDTSLGAGPDNVIQCRCSERRIKPGVAGETLLVSEQTQAPATSTLGPVAAGESL